MLKPPRKPQLLDEASKPKSTAEEILKELNAERKLDEKRLKRKTDLIADAFI